MVSITLIDDIWVVLFILRQRVEAEHGKYVHVKVVNHEPNVAQAAGRLYDLGPELIQLSPEDQIDQNLCDFLQSFQVDVFVAEARDYDRVQALIIQNFLQDFLVLRQKAEALAGELVEDLVLLLEEE